MVAARAERRVRMSALVAGVEDAADPGVGRRVNGGPVQRNGIGGGVAGRNQQQLVGPGESLGQGAGLGIVGVAHLHTTFGEPPGPGWITDRDGKLVGGEVLEQVLGGGPVKCALADAMFDAVLQHVTTGASAQPDGHVTASTVAFRTVVPHLDALSDAERQLLAEWLDRTIKGG